MGLKQYISVILNVLKIKINGLDTIVRVRKEKIVTSPSLKVKSILEMVPKSVLNHN
jgi:hypothetical protein